MRIDAECVICFNQFVFQYLFRIPEALQEFYELTRAGRLAVFRHLPVHFVMRQLGEISQQLADARKTYIIKNDDAVYVQQFIQEEKSTDSQSNNLVVSI